LIVWLALAKPCIRWASGKIITPFRMRPIATVQASDFALEIAAIARLDGLIDSEVGARLDERWNGLGVAKRLKRAEWI